MSMALVRLGTMVLFMTPSAVKLFVCRSDRGWSQPILVRVWRRGGIFLVDMKRDASYYSAAEDMTNLMIWARVRSGPLLAGMGTSPERNMWAADRLRALL